VSTVKAIAQAFPQPSHRQFVGVQTTQVRVGLMFIISARASPHEKRENGMDKKS